MFVTLQDLTLHYRLEGAEGGPPLVFLNSLGTDLRVWDAVVPHFAGRFRILRYDKRGHGLSDAPSGGYTIRDHSGDLLGLLERFELGSAVLVGLSVGGMIAMDLAARFPGRVAALVLCDTGAKIGTREAWDARIDAIRREGLDGIAGAVLQRWFAPSFAERHPDAYRGYRNMLSRTPEAGYVGTCAAIRDADLREAARSIGAPTLVLFGADDVATPSTLGRELAGTLPDARFELIDEAGHLPCVEQPEAVAHRIGEFLREQGYD